MFCALNFSIISLPTSGSYSAGNILFIIILLIFCDIFKESLKEIHFNAMLNFN